MSDRNLQRVVEHLIHDRISDIPFLDIAEFEDKEGHLSEVEMTKVDQLLTRAHVLVYW